MPFGQDVAHVPEEVTYEYGLRHTEHKEGSVISQIAQVGSVHVTQTESTPLVGEGHASMQDLLYKKKPVLQEMQSVERSDVH